MPTRKPATGDIPKSGDLFDDHQLPWCWEAGLWEQSRWTLTGGMPSPIRPPAAGVQLRCHRHHRHHNAQLYAEVQKQAITDALTGLPGRSGFELGGSEVERAPFWTSISQQ